MISIVSTMGVTLNKIIKADIILSRQKICMIQHLRHHAKNLSLIMVAPMTFKPLIQKHGDQIELFYFVKPGMTVIVGYFQECWFMADVLNVVRDKENNDIPVSFLVADVEHGLKSWVEADLITHIVPAT